MTIPIEQLAAQGFSQEAIAALRARGVTALLPLQERALTEHGVLHGRNLVISAPTSSGKTLVAELAALRHLERNRRVVYLVPTKALAEEKHREFQAFYGPLGYRVAVATRERPDADGVVLGGRYDLLVAVYEKWKSYLVVRPEVQAGVALVVADEVQSIGEAGRGDAIDLLMTKVRQAPGAASVQILALSAVLGDDAARLAAWLGCELLTFQRRPVELREGVYDVASGVFRFRSCNGGDAGEEALVAPRDESPDEAPEGESPDYRRQAIFDLVLDLAQTRGEQAIVFVPTRPMSRNWARHLASRLELPPAQAVLDELAAYEDTHSRELLQEALRHGVAFHNADLSWDLRALIEAHFDAGAIRVLVSTPTLGQGVNLHGRNVVQVPAMVVTDARTGRSAMAALSRSRFRNQGGRGARYRLGAEPFGRSILVARDAHEGERLLRDYVEGEVEPLEPRIGFEALEDYALDLVASRTADTDAALVAFFHNTFSGRTLWEVDSAPLARAVERAAASLVEKHLLTRGGGGRLEATGLGEVAAATGLRPSSVLRMAAWLREGPRVLTDEPLEALVVLASTEDARDFALGDPARRDSAEAWAAPLRERLLERVEGVAPTVREILCPEGGFTRGTLGDFRKALVLDAWIGPDETRHIEERFQLFSGTVANLASHFAWLTQAAAALARALALPAAACEALDTLAGRLVLGCAAAGSALRPLHVPGLSRAYVQALLREGLGTPQALADAASEVLERAVPPRVAAHLAAEAARLAALAGGERSPARRRRTAAAPSEVAQAKVAQAEVTQAEVAQAFQPVHQRQAGKPAPPASLPDVAPAALASPVAPAPPPPRLELLLAATPPRARLDGRPLALDPDAVQLLALLAESPGETVPFEAIAPRVWPGKRRAAEAQRIARLARRLADALKTATNAANADAPRSAPAPASAPILVRLAPGEGVVLDLAAGQIRCVVPHQTKT